MKIPILNSRQTVFYDTECYPPVEDAIAAAQLRALQRRFADCAVEEVVRGVVSGRIRATRFDIPLPQAVSSSSSRRSRKAIGDSASSSWRCKDYH